MTAPHAGDAAAGDSAPARPGRRRDPAKEQALLEASLEVYAEVGWAGFTFEAVSRRSGVGRPAIYLRWESREELLLDAMGLLDLPQVDTDTGTLEGDLVVLGEALVSWWTSVGARAWTRLQVDHDVVPQVGEVFYGVHVRRNVQAAAMIVDRAIERGELADRAEGIVLLEMVNGAIHTRIVDTPPQRRGEFEHQAPAYVRRLARLTAAAAGASGA